MDELKNEFFLEDDEEPCSDCGVPGCACGGEKGDDTDDSGDSGDLYGASANTKEWPDD